MTGSRTPGKRVVVLDGFAGRGRYPNGEPASAELILLTSLRLNQVIVESVLVERKRSDFATLNALVREYGECGVRSRAVSGDVVQHLPGVVTQATGVSLF